MPAGGAEGGTLRAVSWRGSLMRATSTARVGAMLRLTALLLVASPVGAQTDICDVGWPNYGVCNGTWNELRPSGYSTATMDLSGMTLDGTLPSEMGLHQSLVLTLDLDNNEISGTLPTQLGLLVKLESSLLLASNKFAGYIPTQLGLFATLNNTIDLRGNDLSGTLPTEMGNLADLGDPGWVAVPETTSLGSIHLNHNELSGTVASELGLLLDMAGTLTLTNNLAISGTLPPHIGNLTKLASLNIQKTLLMSGTLPRQLGKMDASYRLTLNINAMSGTIPSELGLVTKLGFEFVVGNNDLSGTRPSRRGAARPSSVRPWRSR